MSKYPSLLLMKMSGVQVLVYGISAIICFCKCTGVSGEPPKNNVIYCEDGTIESAKITNKYYYTDCKNDCALVKNCPPPKTTFLALFGEHGLDVDKIRVVWLQELNYDPSSKLEAGHFRGLNLKQVTIRYKEVPGVLPGPQENFLESVSDVTYLDFSFGKLMPIPHSKLEKAVFHKGASEGPFGGCEELQTVSMTLWEVYEDSFLASCPKLDTLTLQQLTGSTVQRILHGVKILKHLSIKYSQFKDEHILTAYILPDGFFDDLGNLVTLDMDSNGIGAMPKVNISFPFLEQLSFKNNKLGSVASGERTGASAVASIIRRAPRLQSLDVSDNEEFDLCAGDYDPVGRQRRRNVIEHPALRILILDKTKSTIDCITKEGLPALEYLDLVETKLKAFQFENLLISKVPLRVSFYSSPVKQVFFDENLLNDLRSRRNRTNIKVVGLTSLDCDCNNAYFIRAIKEKLFTAELVTCKGGEDDYIHLRRNKKLSIKATQTAVINKIDISKLECHKFTCHDKCLCRRFWENNSTTANCRKAEVSQIPREDGLRLLEASFNHIEKLHPADFPDSLTFADLSANHIAHIGPETSKQMFSVPHRRIRLSGNPIACDCENRLFIEQIQLHQQQVEDLHNMTCANEGIIALIDVNTEDLCPKITVLSASIAVSLSFLVGVVLIAAFHYRYGRTVKIFLFARGWFTCCLEEDTMDSDRIYDAFISFCHEDEQLVIEEFVPRLEQFGYKTCVHYRDWSPGELIPTHIVRSVESSRRTIVLLSRSFLKSMWGLLEWRIAHARALKEGVTRVLLVILDESADAADIDPDLRSYLRSNTYVRWNDPWFWDKIRYAMPRPRPQRKLIDEDSGTTQTGIGNHNYITTDTT